MKSAQDYLRIAKETMDERGKTYDKNEEIDIGGDTFSSQERSMKSTVTAFNAIAGHNLSESDGWLLMLVLKQVRQNSSETFHEDSALDSVAYSALLAESLEKEGEIKEGH